MNNLIVELKITASDGTVLADIRTQVPTAEAEIPLLAPAPSQRHQPLRQQIYSHVRLNPGIQAKAIPDLLGTSNTNSVSATLTEMKKEGLVENGAGEFNSWQWTVTDKTPPWEQQSS